VDEQALERLKLEQEDRRKRLLERAGRIFGYLPRPIEIQVQDFLNKLSANATCWTLKSTDYGAVWINSRRWSAHRFMFFIVNNPSEMPIEVCHTCDNPPCVNPSHLFPGNPKLNAEDRDMKGRGAIGERHARARLTAKMVSEIRNQHLMGRTGISLAREYGVTNTHITYIVKRKLWRSI